MDAQELLDRSFILEDEEFEGEDENGTEEHPLCVTILIPYG